MIFVKHCPDTALASVFKYKPAEKWTAGEIQEHIVEHQREARPSSQVKASKHPQGRHVYMHVQKDPAGGK